MIINKYNSAKVNLSTRTGVSTGSISSDSSSSSGGVSIDRVLWGQNDNGEDIDGSMWINGSLYLGAIDYGSEDDEETTTDAGDIFIDDAETGSLIADALVQSRDMYCKEHPYITYPITNGKKTDLRELFNGFDERIKTNTTNIATNTTNIAANTTEITKLKSRVSTNETNIKTNTTNISTNATNIKNLDKRVTTNTTNISTNATNITSIDTRVTKLENKVADKSDYEDLKTKVDGNTTNIATNTTDITNIKNEIKNLQDAMPVGSIIMFNGKAEEIPSGWAICNGENGTPNLIDRFILASTYCGGTGGQGQITLSVSQLPPHRHRLKKCWYGKSDNADDRQVVRWDDSVSTNDQILTEETGFGLPINIMPPYYRLIYIMKVGTTDKDTTQTI